MALSRRRLRRRAMWLVCMGGETSMVRLVDCVTGPESRCGERHGSRLWLHAPACVDTASQCSTQVLRLQFKTTTKPNKLHRHLGTTKTKTKTTKLTTKWRRKRRWRRRQRRRRRERAIWLKEQCSNNDQINGTHWSSNSTTMPHCIALHCIALPMQCNGVDDVWVALKIKSTC